MIDWSKIPDSMTTTHVAIYLEPLVDLVKSTPNDQELEEKIRQFITDLANPTSTTFKLDVSVTELAPYTFTSDKDNLVDRNKDVMSQFYFFKTLMEYPRIPTDCFPNPLTDEQFFQQA